jgi:protein-S-isoprenylcysteine O-methyltransferase Ste14
MTLLGHTALGIIILLLLGALVLIKRFATGDVFDAPGGTTFVQLVNFFNLFFLLVVNPAAAILLLSGSASLLDPVRIAMTPDSVAAVVECTGLLLYGGGFFLMAWALMTLRRNYQLGGSTPRPGDRFIAGGPYRRVRHPMYTAALAISLGLFLLLQSYPFLAVFLLYLILMLRLIPFEEMKLRTAYGEEYEEYRQRTNALLPF